jgi:hypothetical protein
LVSSHHVKISCDVYVTHFEYIKQVTTRLTLFP